MWVVEDWATPGYLPGRAEHSVEGLPSVGDEGGLMPLPTIDPLTAMPAIECQQVCEQAPSELGHSSSDRQLHRSQGVALRSGERRCRQ